MSEITINIHKSRIALDRWLETRQNHLMEDEKGLKKIFCLVKDKNEVERFVFIFYRETSIGFRIVDLHWVRHSYSSLIMQQNWQRNYDFKCNSDMFIPKKFKKVDKEFVKYLKSLISTLELPNELLQNEVIYYKPKGVSDWNNAFEALIYPNNFNYNNSSSSLLSS